MRPTLLAIILPVLWTSNTHAGVRACDLSSNVGDFCSIPILSARPTQIAVGMREVEKRAAELDALSEKELEKYLKKKPIPAVLGPGHQYFITDHHHLALALLRLGFEELHLEIKLDLSNLHETEFWNRMESARLAYPYDEKGHGPHNYSDLPKTVDQLKDDPYRSLAWAVEEEKAIEKTNYPYAPFLWANFFRDRISEELVKDNYKKAIKKAVELASSNEARNLPGYNEKQ